MIYRSNDHTVMLREKCILAQMLLHTENVKVTFKQIQEKGCLPEWVCLYVCLCTCLWLCLLERNLRRRISCDEVLSLWWPHSGTSVSLTVQLPLHKEIPLLFEVDVTVGAHKAARVMIFIPCFHHCPAVA